MANSYKKTRIRSIIRRFGMRALRSTPVSSFYRASAIFRVRTDVGTFALKPFYRSKLLRSSTMQQMKEAAEGVRILTNAGYSYMARWMSTRAGALWVVNRGRPYYLTDWIQGRSLQSPMDFEKLGRALAVLHTPSGSLPASRTSPTWRHIQLLGELDRLFRERIARSSGKKGEYGKWLSKYGASCSHLAERALNELKSLEFAALFEEERARPALIHGDITSPNVIVSDDGRLFIIDWDRVKKGSTYAETAQGLKNTTQFDPAFIQSLLRGYEEQKPLSRSERKMIAILYSIPQEAWYIARYPNRQRSREMMNIIDHTWPLYMSAMKLMNEWADQ